MSEQAPITVKSQEEKLASQFRRAKWLSHQLFQPVYIHSYTDPITMAVDYFCLADKLSVDPATAVRDQFWRFIQTVDAPPLAIQGKAITEPIDDVVSRRKIRRKRQQYEVK